MLGPIIALLVALVVAPPTASASSPTPDAGLWTFFFAQGPLGPSAVDSTPENLWLWAFDGQARFLDEANGFAQSLVRPVVGRKLGRGFALWQGYAWIRTAPASGGEFDEHRPFQQLTWTGKLGSVGILSRTRFEQRIIDRADEVSLRFRQFVKAGVPIGLGTDLQAVAYEEAFFHLNNADDGPRSGFDQNRFFVGLAQPIADNATFELGYLNQLVRRRGADPLNHILSLNLFLSF